MKTLAFLHTAAVHEGTFDNLLAGVPVERIHDTQPGLLADAQRDGLTPSLRSTVSSRLADLRRRADVVICTCSTLGPITDALSDPAIFRIDAPMMAQAARLPGSILVAYCVASTLTPTGDLLAHALRSEGRSAEDWQPLDCTACWPAFEAGDTADYAARLAATIGAAVHTGEWGCVVLAQASMAVAAPLMTDLPVPVLDSPGLAVAHTLALLDGSTDPA